MKVSEYYSLGKSQAYLDFVDIELETDIAVFLDPTAIKALNTDWGEDLAALLKSFFETVMNHIHAGQDQKAQGLLESLRERNEFHLGFSQGKSRGHAFGAKSAKTVWGALSSSNAALTGLLKDLEDTCLFIDGIGPDMISDAVCNILRGPLIEYTQDMCTFYDIPLVDNVDSGPIWNSDLERWDQALVPLPMANGEPFILVPKSLARYSLTYSFDSYYRYFLLPRLQIEEAQMNSALVHIIKSTGERKVYKKDLELKYGKSKLVAVENTEARPDMLDKYRAEKTRQPLRPLENLDFSQVLGVKMPDWKALERELRGLNVGANDAHKYEELIKKIFTALFYPSLSKPKRESPLHEGRKRIDIRYTNEAYDGFFSWLYKSYTCPYIFVECKNYGKEVGNPEIDQLSGRFSKSRGQVGILVCRSIKDRQTLIKRCKDTANDDRGYIIAIDDDDIIQLLEEKRINPESHKYKILYDHWDKLVM